MAGAGRLTTARPVCSPARKTTRRFEARFEVNPVIPPTPVVRYGYGFAGADSFEVARGVSLLRGESGCGG